ncbi:Hypothetical predicted protein [Mytilus galloprovincialis]|uniref:Fibrinogen C-terminal domain-containing protein n=1 Tax=Mytilus galloprovincialis TaxID=29158 RepID=A0A8B6BP09_MYTGA|nr:Hypothetical predicted protein [Mytilus galloprovincialis]
MTIRQKVNIVKDKLNTVDADNWLRNVHNDRNCENGNKLRTFRQYKSYLQPSSYVKSVKFRDYRRTLSNFRCDSLPLAIETGRYTKPVTPLNERICQFCDENTIETEQHFLMNCNAKINRLTSSGKYRLRIYLGDFSGNHAYAEYKTFFVGDAASKYKLTVSGYKGNAGDSLAYHNGMTFSTKDDNRNNCAVTYKGAWWYKGCHHSNLNGLFNGAGPVGISWYHWKSSYDGMKTSTMMIRITNV